jgi:hypothetical protein
MGHAQDNATDEIIGNILGKIKIKTDKILDNKNNKQLKFFFLI